MSLDTDQPDPHSPSRRFQPRRAAKSASTMVGLHRSDSTASSSSAHLSTDTSHRQRAFSSSRMSNGSGSDADEIRFTKTGRISRALKGKRVHVCELCDKFYTRAEHLRRHQLNHGKEPLQCNVPGCKRQFYREDLLLRHREDHKLTNTLQSQSSSGAYGDQILPGFTLLSTPQLSHASSIAGQSSAELGFGDAFTSGLSSFDFSHDTHQDTSLSYSFPSWDAVSAPSTIPDLYESSDTCTERFDGLQPATLYSNVLPTEDLLTPPLDPYPSGSSYSELSPTIPVWPMLDRPTIRHDFYSENTPEQSVYAHCDVSLLDLQPLIGPGMGENGFDVGRYYTELDVFEGARINQILDGSVGQSMRREGYSNITVMEDLYSSAFWDHFHPLYPILHVPSYQVAEASPMLRALTIAIGACMVEDDPKTKMMSCVLRDVCAGLLEKRQEVPYPLARLSDLKAIFWAEFFLLHRSRRTGRGMSKRFQDLLTNLQSDPAVWSRNPLEDIESLPLNPEPHLLSRVKHRWIINESKRRLLQSCYTLTYERATLFPDDLVQPPTFLDPPLPCSTTLWEASTPQAWLEIARQETVMMDRLIDVIGEFQQISKVPHAVASMMSHAAYVEDPAVAVDRSAVATVHNTYRVQMAMHSGCMATLVPLHDLLAVSGESFVMGRKLATQEELRQAQLSLRDWLQSERAANATHHALQVLRLVLRNDKVVLLQEKWILYLAALVCWAGGIKGRMDQRTNLRHAPSDRDVQHFVNKLLVGSPGDVFTHDWSGAEVLLQWVRNRIAGCIGGLIEDAITVLDRLLQTERRNH